MQDGFIKVAAGTPKIRVADCRYNAEQIFTLMREADQQGVRVLCLPELCLTGATCGDLFFQDTLLKGAEEGLATILEATKNLDMVTALGLPVRVEGKLCNCAAVVHRGELLGLVPKNRLSNVEKRWFYPGEPLSVATLWGENYLMNATRFSCDTMPELSLDVVVGDNLPRDPGATVILNLTAHHALVGGAARRRRQVCEGAERLICGLICADAGEGESTTDAVFAGHNLIVERGALLAERQLAAGLTVSELDVGRLAYERRRLVYEILEDGGNEISFALEPSTTTLTRPVSPTPFLPENSEERAQRCEEILKIAALGLKQRLEHTRAQAAVIGLSGGLDSTLAVLIAALAMQLLGRPAQDIIAVTMPCFGTTDRTRDNAVELAERLGATLRRVDISDTVRSHFRDIGHPADRQDVTYENAQARERTQVLMDIANQENGLVIGTGDLSELALGWCTYNGDHMSMYSVNGGIPKTLVRQLVSYISRDKEGEDAALSGVLADILDTPVSPELLPAVNGRIAQKTEDLVGPYELHDFFLYYVLRWGFPPRKILRLAETAFAARYDRATLVKWLSTFYRRFFSQQFKRSCLPDGPAVGSISLSPRGGWVQPSDAVATLWLEELEGLS